MIRKLPSDVTFKFNSTSTLYNTEFYTPSIVESLFNDTFKSPDGQVVNFRNNDVTLLFNQQRLSGLGTDTVNAWLKSIAPASDSLSDLRKKCSDTDLLKFCKSRYIQSASELLAWSQYLDASGSSIIKELNASSQSSDETEVKSPTDTPSETSVSTE